MNRPDIASRLVALGLSVTSGYLVYQRGGLLTWTGLLVALLLLAKHVVRPSSRDSTLALAFTVLWAASWAAAWGYVRSTWESGEVVEIGVRLDGEIHEARVWILDVDGKPTMYYDAPPAVGRALLANAPLTIDRGTTRLSGCARATPVERLPEDEVAALFALMQAKYQERNRATDVFYVLLGVERERMGLVLGLGECP